MNRGHLQDIYAVLDCAKFKNKNFLGENGVKRCGK